MGNSKTSAKYEKIAVYISAFSVVASILAGIIYVAVSLAKMEIKIEMSERLKELEIKVGKLEK